MFNKLLVASVIAISSISFSAQSAVINLGTLSSAPQTTKNVFNIFSGTLGDSYTFDVATTFAFTSEVTGYDIANFAVSLTKGTTFLFNQDTLVAATPIGSFITANQASFFEKILGPGSYTFSIIGNSTDGSSAYSGSFTLGRAEVAAVPEPETYAMFLAGLGLLGFVSSRKKLS